MTYRERVEALAKICWYYMTELNRIEKEGHEYAQRIDNKDPDANIVYLKVLDRRRTGVRDGFIAPLTKLLHKEGISSMKVEDGLIKLTLKNGRELTFEEKEEDSPTGYWIYEYTERSDYGEFFICPKCGGLSRDKTRYCPHCGRRILPFEGEESKSN